MKNILLRLSVFLYLVVLFLVGIISCFIWIFTDKELTDYYPEIETLSGSWQDNLINTKPFLKQKKD